METLKALDLGLLVYINQVWVQPWLDVFFAWVTKPPYEEVYFVSAALALIVFGGRKGRIAALTLVFAVTLSDQISASLLKPLIGRVRPCFAHPDQIRLVLEHQSHSPSFPSSHATNAFAVAIVLFGVRKLLGWAMLALAVVLAYSRPYVGVHYPSDVLFGAVLGAGIGWGCVAAREWGLRVWQRRRKERA